MTDNNEEEIHVLIEEEDDEDPIAPGGSIGVEVVGADEFDFLDGVSELAALEIDLCEVRQKVAVSRNNGTYNPLKMYRPYNSNSLSVTDVQSGLWCQSQLEYRYLHPHMRKTEQWKKQARKGNAVQKKTPVMITGSVIHQKKELEVHAMVEIPVRTKEDRRVVDLLNTYRQLSVIKNRGMERELVVFGDPFDSGILITGKIDQVEYQKESMELIVTDLKTRRSDAMPGHAQKLGNSFQLMMYKLLLDGLIMGCASSIKLLVENLHLNSERKLSCTVVDYILELGYASHFPTVAQTHTLSFGEAVKTLSALIRGLDFPPVTKLKTEYIYQATNELIGIDEVEFDRNWAREKLEGEIKFWRGEKRPSGPDIEDLWKCSSCQFKNVCVWTKRKELEKSPASKQTTPM